MYSFQEISFTPTFVVFEMQTFRIITNFIELSLKQVKEWIKHPNYNSEVGSNNIALLRLSKNLTLNYSVGKTEMPFPFESYSGQCMIAGWGRVSGCQEHFYA